MNFLKPPQFALISALLLTSCAQYRWMHPDHNDAARFNRDSYECERDMRQSGYYGGGLVGQINAQGFAERCMFARGYYKASLDQTSSRTPSAVAAVPAQASAAVSTPPVPPVTVQTPTPAIAPTPSTPAGVRIIAQLYLIRGRVVSNPPQSFSAVFSENGEATVVLDGPRRLTGNYELFGLGESIKAKYNAQLVNPDGVKPFFGADAKGFARFSDPSLQLECAFAMTRSSARGDGTCRDSEGNTYRVSF